MCWSARVSYEFACLDTLFVLLLLGKKMGVRWRRMLWSTKRRRRRTSDNASVDAVAAPAAVVALPKNGRKRESFAGTYAALMVGIAIQEWAQYGLWVRGHLHEEDLLIGTQTQTNQQHDTVDLVLSILTILGADSVPLVAIISSGLIENSKTHHGTNHKTVEKKNRSHKSKQQKINSRRRWEHSSPNAILRNAQMLWIIQAGMLLLTILYTHQYVVTIGPNHHQQWICETAAYRFGGPTMHAVFYWTYIASGILGMYSFDEKIMNVNEKRSIMAIGLISGFLSFLLYSKSLEACSIWCWSAFTLGIYLCLQEDVIPSLL